MNSAVKGAIFNQQSNCIHVRAALFHSTPVLERKRRFYWDSRSNNYSRRSRSLHAKKSLLRNLNAYADHLFQSWQKEYDEDPSSSQGTSWFQKDYCRTSRRGSCGNQGHWHWGRRKFEFCEEDDDEVETLFRSAFGGNRFFYWSFINEENPPWRGSFRYSSNYGKSWKWRYQFEEDDDDKDDSSTESESSASDRLALGLRAYGPLELEDVKKAYRTCALKWHPDRHHGSSKAVAEEKFKLCSAAYQSLCDKLAVN